MRASVSKKLRKLNNKVRAEIPQAVNNALLEIKKWPFGDKWKFCRWLLFGKGDWKGVK